MTQFSHTALFSHAFAADQKHDWIENCLYLKMVSGFLYIYIIITYLKVIFNLLNNLTQFSIISKL